MRAWLVLFLVGCEGASHVAGVDCTSNSDCKLGAVSGTCEATKFCSYPDSTCDGNRYGPGAGSDLSNTCVTGPASCGGKDQACCTGDLCGTDLACDATTKTCTCGGKGEVCCTSSVCQTNLVCSSGTCACGSIGDPCCDGTTCNTGLACSAGTCDGGVLSIAVGEAHTCALRSDHTVTCWGHDSKPYAVHVPSMSTTTIATPTPISVPGLTDVAALRAGGKHTCARKMDGTLWCWGHNESGQLGDGTTNDSASPVQVTGLSGVTLFDVGKFHSCAVGTVSGSQGLWCWGHGTQGSHANTVRDANLGRLGNGDLLDHATPVKVDLSAATTGGQTVKWLSTGVHHSCVAMSDNTVWCWGANSAGQLGNGMTTSTKVPVAVNLASVTIPPGAAIEEVACSRGNGIGTSCLRLSNGAVYCWGSGRYGEFGDGSSITPTPPANRTAPTTAVSTASLGGTFNQLVAGADNVCGRDTTGAVYCWGHGISGAMGNDSLADQPAPVTVVGASGATQLDMGHRDACIVDGSSQLYCWGNNRGFRMTNGIPTGPVLHAVKVPL